MKWSSGSVYDGDFVNDHRHGYGRMVWSGGEQMYDGMWELNLPHGQGIYLEIRRHGATESLNRYEGDSFLCEWGMIRLSFFSLFGSLNSCFEYVNISPSFCVRSFFKGNFHRGMREGLGVFQYADGSMYAGEWSKNLKVFLECSLSHFLLCSSVFFL